MLKRLGSHSAITYLQDLCLCILDDVQAHYSTSGICFLKDKECITRLVAARGIHLFLVDLPELDRLLLAGLSCGKYSSGSEALSKSAQRRGTIPKFLQGLYLLVFSRDGYLLENASHEAIRYLRQIFLFAKKYKIDCPDSAKMRVLAEFYEYDESLPNPSRIWSDLENDVISTPSLVKSYEVTEPSDVGLIELFQKVCDVVASGFPYYTPYEWEFKHGPGAVADPDPACRYKYRFRKWSAQLEEVFPSADFAFANYADWVDRHHQLVESDTIVSSRLILVPKSYKGPRLIAAEPTAHQWCQQNIRQYLEHSVEHSYLRAYIPFGRQDINANLAKMASLSRSHVTADLSAASDGVSCELVSSAFRRNHNLLRALVSCRTRYISQNISERFPAVHRLRKFSTMGSACTFPVENLLFACMGLAALCYEAGIKHPNARVLKTFKGALSVFGDDIIIANAAWGSMQRLLTLLRFRVNTSKTFATGRFRESCGVDAYDGEIVTPVRINTSFKSESPESVLSAIDASNNLHLAGYWRAADYIKSTIDRYFELPVSDIDSGAIAFKSFVGPSVQRCTWSDDLSCFMAPTTVFETKSEIQPHNSMSCLIQWTVEHPSYGVDWSSGDRTRPALKMRKGRLPVYHLFKNK